MTPVCSSPTAIWIPRSFLIINLVHEMNPTLFNHQSPPPQPIATTMPPQLRRSLRNGGHRTKTPPPYVLSIRRRATVGNPSSAHPFWYFPDPGLTSSPPPAPTRPSNASPSSAVAITYPSSIVGLRSPSHLRSTDPAYPPPASATPFVHCRTGHPSLPPLVAPRPFDPSSSSAVAITDETANDGLRSLSVISQLGPPDPAFPHPAQHPLRCSRRSRELAIAREAGLSRSLNVFPPFHTGGYWIKNKSSVPRSKPTRSSARQAGVKAPPPPSVKRPPSRKATTKATLRRNAGKTSSSSESITSYFLPITHRIANATGKVIASTKPTQQTSPLDSVDSDISVEVEALPESTRDQRTLRRLKRTLASPVRRRRTTSTIKSSHSSKGQGPTVSPSASNAKPVRSVDGEHWVPPPDFHKFKLRKDLSPSPSSVSIFCTNTL